MMPFLHTKLIFRNLWRNRLYTGLNLTGLAIGMAAAMLIALWVQNELRFDQYHQRADNLYRINTDHRIDAQETWHWALTPLKITELCAQTPGVVATAQLMRPVGLSMVLQRGAELFDEDQFAYVGPGWFETFDYAFAEGSAAGFGERPNDLILSESIAQKIFGKRSALGATLRIDSTEFVVYAVMNNPRSESSFQEHVILPQEAWLKRGNTRENDAQWGNFNYHTFAELKQGVQPGLVAAQLTKLLTEVRQDTNVNLRLCALSDLHFDQEIKEDHIEKGSKRSVATFALVGLLILLMAAINYVSLTTARAQTRAQEAGIRKVIGANRRHIFGQFLAESAVLTAGAGILALLMVQTALAAFSKIAGRDFELPWTSPLPWLLFGATLLGTVMLAGIYPALLMTRFQPLKVLRGGGTNGSSRSSLRQSLVVAQFTISIGLLISTIVIGRQRAFIQNKDMGYERDQIFTFSINWRQYRDLGEKRGESMLNALKQTLQQSSAVAGITRASESPVHILGSHSGSVRFDGLPEQESPTVSKIDVDDDFADLFGLKLAEGRWFEPGNKADEQNVVLNETAARKLGLPEPWLGQRFSIYGQDGRVIGLVRDFHFLPLHQSITPLVICSSQQWLGYFFIKTQPGKSTEALTVTESVWKQWFPGYPFKYTFLDDDFNQMYEQERRAGVLFNLFSGITILLAGLGLFGLATFVAVQRAKEVGVRKVLGASVAGIVLLLSKDFLKLVVVALVLAIPLAYYAMQHWLQDFAYRIELEWWMFAAAGVAALLTALFTVGFQSVKAALADPVKSLKND